MADYRASTPTDAAKRIVPDVAEERRGITQMRDRARAALEARLSREHSALQALRSRPVLANPGVVVDRELERLGVTLARLRGALTVRLDRAESEVKRLHAQTVALSPAGTLARGYAVVRDRERQVVLDATRVAIGDTLEVLLAHGRLGVEVSASHEETFDPVGEPAGGTQRKGD